MLSQLRPRSIYDVMAAIGCFAAFATGTAYAADTIRSSDIVDGEVKSIDVGQNEIKSADVKDESLTTFDVSTFLGADVVDGTLTGDDIGNGSLNDEDVGQATFVNFLASINRVDAHSCGYNTVTGVNAAGDHLVLTPSFDASPGIINYTAEYAADGTVKIKACNPTDFAYGAHTTRFNLLVFDAQ